jgi:hypothetical protein
LPVGDGSERRTNARLEAVNNGHEHRKWDGMDVQKIWGRAPHNAFTDLIRFKDTWYCAFREGQGHVSDDGSLRVIRSVDGEEWTSAGLMTWDGGDVRDAKLSVAGDGQLMLNGAVRFLEPRGGDRHQSVTWLSSDGHIWSEPYACPSGLGTWRWSATWNKGTGYSFGYSGRDDGGALYRTTDGKSWEAVVRDIFPEGYANETSIVFGPDDTAICLLRRDPRDDFPGSALLGTARPPYADWAWADLGMRLGGPKLIRCDDGRLLAVVRLYEPVRTSLCEIDSATNTVTELQPLPSGGDTSYAGMVVHNGRLWVSYYSSHEEKTQIYLARLELP